MRIWSICLIFIILNCECEGFDHSPLDRVLQRWVNEQGRVDYEHLASDDDLSTYVKLLAQKSPNTHPILFPQRTDSLTFWINTYNALVLWGVSQSYPVASVTEIAPEFGFFKKRLFIVGGQSLTLDYIEHEIIRKQFRDPRIHAALNCAAISCPPLQRRAFVATKLDDQLNAAMLNMVRSCVIDRERGILRLSSIFKWFSTDFIFWVEEKYSGETLLDYVSIFLPEEDRLYLQKHSDMQVIFTTYDWSLNDQRE